MTLRYYYDMPVAQIATTLGLSVNTVKTHLQRGLDALGTTLEADRFRPFSPFLSDLKTVTPPSPSRGGIFRLSTLVENGGKRSQTVESAYGLPGAGHAAGLGKVGGET